MTEAREQRRDRHVEQRDGEALLCALRQPGSVFGEHGADHIDAHALGVCEGDGVRDGGDGDLLRARMLGVVLGVERVDHVRDRDVLRAPRRRRTRRPLREPMLSTARRLGLQHAHDWLADEFVGPRVAAAWRLGARLCLAESCLDEGLAHLDRRRRAISGNQGRSHLDRGGAPSAAIKGDCTSSDQAEVIKGDCTSSDQAEVIKGDCTSSDQAEVVPPSIGAVALLFFLGFALRERVKARCTELMGTSRNSANGAGYLKQGGRRGGHGCR
jgi:hypothetical protein